MTATINEPRAVTHEEWLAEGRERFGPDQRQWLFVCPACGFVASAEDYINAGGMNMAGFSCIGRLVGPKRQAFCGDPGMPGPCDYAGGGLIRLNPVIVSFPDGTLTSCMEWAPPAVHS